MSQPTIYFPAFSFTSYQSTHPTDPLPGANVDNELFTIAQSIAEICQNLKLIQRDDGALANNSVGAAQLQAALSIGLNNCTPWVTNHQYIANNFVYGPDNNVYQCLLTHISGTFSVDLANQKWVLVLSFATATTAATNAGSSATAAASSATAAATSATAAANSANSLTGTSATSQTPATGAMTFTTQAGLYFPAGGYVNITSSANPTVNNMFAQITSYSGTTLVVNNLVANGGSAHTDWTISVAGARGATGATGSPGAGTGDMLKANNLSELANFATARANLGLGAAAQEANSFFCQTANNLNDVANAATSLSNLGGLSATAAASTYAPLASPTFTGTPSLPTGATAVTQASSDNSTKLATTAYVKSQSFPLMTALGVGAIIAANWNTIVTGGFITAGTGVAAALISPVMYLVGTGWVVSGDTISGTWRALQGNNNQVGQSIILFQRIA